MLSVVPTDITGPMNGTAAEFHSDAYEMVLPQCDGD